MKPRVAIIYLCYGNLRHLPEVVSSFAALTYPKDRMEIVMVPNNSPDGIAEVIRRDVLPRAGADLPCVHLIDDGVNRGFAGGNNHGIRLALEQGFDYVFLNNGDLKLHPEAISELVDHMENDVGIGSAQSLVLYWNDHGTVNVSGGEFHLAGYGFARDNLTPIASMKATDGGEVTYASGAAVLYRAQALANVGLLEEGFFMYHEDLELGLRLRVAGYTNIVCTDSWAYHDYSFSRNPKKFAWMELYRWVVVLAYYRTATLILVAPILLAIELGTWMMALKGGWARAKAWAYGQWLLPRTWKLLWMMRRRTARLRTISDRELLRHVTGTIEAQETSSPFMNRLVNPVIRTLLRVIRLIVIW